MRTILIDYSNHRGERSDRRIVPYGAPWFGTTQWHPLPCWLLTAWDVEKGARRDFALTNIHGMRDGGEVG